MATALYDYFLAPSDDRGGYSNATAPGSVFYPDSNQVNVMGPLYVPRVYGKDLTALELASSGIIAISLADIHSFDLAREVEASNITLKTIKQDSFLIGVNSDRMGLTFAAGSDSNNITLYTDSNMLLSACNDLSLASKNFSQTLVEDYNLNAANIFFNAACNIEGGANVVEFYGSNEACIKTLNAEVCVTNNVVSVTASNDLLVVAPTMSNSATTVDFKVANLFNVDSGAKFGVQASNEIFLGSLTNAGSKVTLDARNLYFAAEDGSANKLFDQSVDGATGNSTILSAGVIAATAPTMSNTTQMFALAASNATVHVAEYLDMFSDSNARLCAASNLELCADTGLLDVHSVTMDVIVSSAITTSAPTQSNSASNMYVGVSEFLYMHSDSNARLCAASNLYINTCEPGGTLTIEATTLNQNAQAINVAASNTFALVAPTTGLTACNLNIGASNTTWTGDQVDMTLTDSFDLLAPQTSVTACNLNIAASNTTLTGDQVSVTLTDSFDMLAPQTGFTACNLVIGASNTTLTGDQVSVTLTDSFDMIAPQTGLTACNLNVGASNTMFTGDTFGVNTSSNIVLSTSNMWFTACNFVYNFDQISVLGTNIASAGSNVTLKSDGAMISITPSNISFTSSNYVNTTASNVNTTASNVMIMADEQACLHSIGAAVCVSPSNVHITSSNVIEVTASNDLFVTASNDFNVNILQDTLYTVGGSTQWYSSGTITERTAGSFDLAASNNFVLQSVQNTTLTVGGTTGVFSQGTITERTAGSLSVAASNAVSITADGTHITLDANSNVYLKAYDNDMFVTLDRDINGSNVITGEADIYKWKVEGQDLVTIDKDGIKIDGNIQVTGTIDTINVTQSNLQVEDMTIHLATGATTDAVNVNDGAGIYIEGDSTVQKSLLWRKNQGTEYLGTDQPDKNSFWEFQGGALHISHSNATIGDVMFGFRINELGELELVKRLPDKTTYKRVAKFGRTLM